MSVLRPSSLSSQPTTLQIEALDSSSGAFCLIPIVGAPRVQYVPEIGGHLDYVCECDKERIRMALEVMR